MATTTFANVSTENRAVWGKIQTSLSLIMHAHECSKRVQQPTNGNDDHPTSSENICTVAQCAPMRRLLLHMTQCYDRQNCSFRECSVYRSVIFHWRSCTILSCLICRPSRRTLKVKWILNSLLRVFQVSDRPLTPDQLARIKNHAEKIETDAYDTAKSLDDYSKHAMNRVVEIQKICAKRRLLKKQEILATTSAPLDEHVSSNHIVPPSDEMAHPVHETNSNLNVNATDIHMEEDSSNRPAGTESPTENQHSLNAPSTSTNHCSISTTATELDKKVQNNVEGDMSNDLRSNSTIRKSLPKHPAVFSIDDIREKMMPILRHLYDQEEGIWFRQPVTEAIAPGYSDIIKDAMDFSTIVKKFDENQYTTPFQFCEDMWLVFSNTWAYNKKRTPVYQAARVLATLFMEKVDPLMKEFGYCCGCRYVSSMRCHASNCRIPPADDYFVYNNPDPSRNNLSADKYIFCKKCFNSSKSKDMLVGDDSKQISVALLKKEFHRAKNDHEEQESMVDCIECLRRFHEICVLYHESIWPQGYLCEACRRKDNRILARNLPTNKLCKKLEENVNNLLKRECGPDVGRVTIRVLAASDRVCGVKLKFKKHFGAQIPEGYPYRTKAIFAFQEIEGVDVVLFGMHVQEYDSRCPGPNAKRVYISYLDSVRYFRPEERRTDIYYEILIGYLDYVKQLGFTHAHIWACPAEKDDDYIFYCHPVDQLVPSSSRLQEWYKTMLDIAVQQRVVVDYKDMMKDCTDSGVNKASDIPYFEGDFWPDRIEDILKGFEEKSSSQNVNLDDSIESEEPTESSKKRKLDTSSADEKNKKFKKTTSKHSIASLLFDKIKSEMEKQKQLFFVIRLRDNSASDTAPIVDPDPLIPYSLIESRDEFLDFAHNNHCEFSSLRLAKYSTMVLLMELQPSTAYQISYVCDVCEQPCDIRYHCKTCEDYDLCTKCYHEGKHEHQMERVGEANETIITNSALSIHTIHHAEQCQNGDCTFDNCTQCKQLIQHLKGCTKRPRTACPLCMKFLAPSLTHAKTCTDQNCRLPRCAWFKIKIQQRRIEPGSLSLASASSAITKPV